MQDEMFLTEHVASEQLHQQHTLKCETVDNSPTVHTALGTRQQQQTGLLFTTAAPFNVVSSAYIPACNTLLCMYVCSENTPSVCTDGRDGEPNLV